MANLLATKLHRPAAPPQRVARPHLMARLNRGLQAGRGLTFVSAPAGFGKTTCISTWVAGLDRPVAWLSLDAADDDPGRFFTYLVAALQRVDAGLGREIETVLRSGQLPPAELIGATLSNDVLALEDPFLLVLDDFQFVQDPFILQVLETLITNPLPPLHLVLITREDPALPLARLRAHNRMTELRARELRFTRPEADQLLNRVLDLSLSPEDVEALELKTEGWIAGLQLAALAMQAPPAPQSAQAGADPSRFIARLSGSHRYILSYLTEEVLQRQPAEVQDFLLRTAILNRLNGELCDAVTGRTDSGALLERLLAANLFLIPLDDEGRWYRYHHLFADLLANRLRQTLAAPDVQALHARASRWLAQQDLPDEAIRHALAGQDFEQAAALVERVARSTMFSGRVNTLRNWLEALPETAFETQPRLAVYRVWIDLLQGRSDLSEPGLQEQEKLLEALPPSPENDRLRTELKVMLCRFVALVGSTARAIRLAREALDALPEADRGSRARAHSALAIAYGMEGDMDRAEPAYHRCLQLAQAAGYYSLAAHTTMVMGLGLPYYGQLREAARAFQSIIDMGEAAGQPVFYPAGQGYVGLGVIHLEWNDRESARDYLHKGIALCRQGGLAGTSTARLAQARLHQAEGDLEGALQRLDSPAQALQRGSFIETAARQIQVRLALGDMEGVTRWATPLMQVLGGARPPRAAVEAMQATLARVALAQGEIERAGQLLDQVQATAEPGRRWGRMIEVYVLRALAWQKQHDAPVPPQALEDLQRALALAEPEGYVLLFLEAGPAVRPLLHAVAQRDAAPERIRAYARRLLEALPVDTGQKVVTAAAAPTAPGAEGMIEPLTPRELEVLQLLAEGLTYQEIAENLVLSLNTVRFHVKNLYGKLEAGKRVEAVDRARTLGLI